MPTSRNRAGLSVPTAKDWSAKRAFTLLELLIVMAVMGLMMGLIGFTLLGGGGEELGSAQREVLGLVQQARTRAALSGAETRLIINAVEEDLEKYHRYVELVVKDTCATTNESKWLVMGEGTTLPDGVFFVPEDDSYCEVGDEWREDAFPFGAVKTMISNLWMPSRASARRDAVRNSVIWPSVQWAVLFIHPQAGAPIVKNPRVWFSPTAA